MSAQKPLQCPGCSAGLEYDPSAAKLKCPYCATLIEVQQDEAAPAVVEIDYEEARSRVVKTLVDMRAELATTWERSTASREQMLAHLQDWIARAEASGIQALQNAALRIRSYQLAPAAAH